MGMQITIYGHIEEMEFWAEPVMSKVRQHNKDIILSLPKDDEWPPVSQEMFAFTEHKSNRIGPNLEYGGRVIHFGVNIKSVFDEDWVKWRAKFETLLTRLFFMEAFAHFKWEYTKLQTSSWTIDRDKYHVNHDGTMPEKMQESCWKYESTFDK